LAYFLAFLSASAATFALILDVVDALVVEEAVAEVAAPFVLVVEALADVSAAAAEVFRVAFACFF
jgi:hypothetical protein